MSIVTRETCGKCGVYRHLHPTKLDCKRARLSWWWHRHYLRRHVATWLWVHAFTSRARWRCAERLAARGRDWCGLVDSVLYADKWHDEPGENGWPGMIGHKHDYRGKWGCLCDFPLPLDVGAPRYGSCYCSPPSEVA